MTTTPPSRATASETIVEHVIQAIREGIRHGRFAQGERLVVADVAQLYGVSVGPVREAIRRLTGEGLLEFMPHRGASVRAYSERDIREIFQLREAIEGYAAKLAAENIHRGDYAERLRACQKRLHESAGGTAEELAEPRQHFHDLLYEFGANGAIKEAAERLTFPSNRLMFIGLTGPKRAAASLREHDDIIEAILAGDALRAERLMRVHLHNGAIAVCEVLEESRHAAQSAKKKV
ncbi:MAG: GntR family transcriptional regulator [Hyphomonadaceae bacterium]